MAHILIAGFVMLVGHCHAAQEAADSGAELLRKVVDYYQSVEHIESSFLVVASPPPEVDDVGSLCVSLGSFQFNRANQRLRLQREGLSDICVEELSVQIRHDFIPGVVAETLLDSRPTFGTLREVHDRVQLGIPGPPLVHPQVALLLDGDFEALLSDATVHEVILPEDERLATDDLPIAIADAPPGELFEVQAFDLTNATGRMRVKLEKSTGRIIQATIFGRIEDFCPIAPLPYPVTISIFIGPGDSGVFDRQTVADPVRETVSIDQMSLRVLTAAEDSASATIDEFEARIAALESFASTLPKDSHRHTSWSQTLERMRSLARRGRRWMQESDDEVKGDVLLKKVLDYYRAVEDVDSAFMFFAYAHAEDQDTGTLFLAGGLLGFDRKTGRIHLQIEGGLTIDSEAGLVRIAHTNLPGIVATDQSDPPPAFDRLRSLFDEIQLGTTSHPLVHPELALLTDGNFDALIPDATVKAIDLPADEKFVPKSFRGLRLPPADAEQPEELCELSAFELVLASRRLEIRLDAETGQIRYASLTGRMEEFMPCVPPPFEVTVTTITGPKPDAASREAEDEIDERQEITTQELSVLLFNSALAEQGVTLDAFETRLDAIERFGEDLKEEGPRKSALMMYVKKLRALAERARQH